MYLLNKCKGTWFRKECMIKFQLSSFVIIGEKFKICVKMSVPKILKKLENGAKFKTFKQIKN